ncbi:MAG TPA: HK97 family phage prohead protease [Gemmata sp.]|nr:HK97 family phage prohead protease [Gemmata sp.]
MWPAPSTSPTSFWSAYQQRQQVRQRPGCVRRTGAIPFYDRPVTITQPTRSSSSNPAPLADGKIVGMAAKYGKWFSAQPFNREPGVTYRVLWAEGCFDRWFARLRAAKTRAGLWIGHDEERELCSTEDGSLRLWCDDYGCIRFHVNACTRAGRKAIERARTLKCRQCSLGTRFLERYTTKGRHENVMTVFRAAITEVSLVADGSFPGNWVRVT